MPGGLMQLVAYGAENLYLTGNPQITFFKTVYRRHTNFAMEYMEQYFIRLPSFSSDKETIATVKIDRNADLIHDCYLVYDLPAIYSDDQFKFKWVNNVGLRIINYVEIFVEGQLLDKQYGQWMYIWNELSLSLSKRGAYNKLVGNIPTLTDPQFYHGFYENTQSVPASPQTRVMIPLEFWFCKNPGLAIPLIALQYTELTITVHFNALQDLFVIEHQNCIYSPKNAEELAQHIRDTDYSGETEATQTAVSEFLSIINNSAGLIWYFINGSLSPGMWSENTWLLVNYIYLDDDERRKFALSSHEYLMTQTQRRETGALRGSSNMIEYKFQHPIKDMIWVFQRDDAEGKNDWNNFTNQSFGEKFNTEDLEFCDGEIFTVAQLKNFSEVGVTSNADNLIFNNYVDIMYNCKFIFNGKDRFSAQPYGFFNALVPYKYDTNTPADGIYSYSFGLYPEKTQPSGNCNYSRINRFQMDVNLRAAKDPETERNIYYDMYVYGYNYNVFRIIAGIGGVAFS